MAAGTTIHQWEFHGGNSQKWIFDYYGDGYYTLKSANSTSNFYLGIKDDLTTEEAPAVLRTGAITDGMLWEISLTPRGSYRITPKTGNWCLAVDGITSNNGEIIFQDWYAGHNESYRDEWYLHEEDYFMHALTNEFGFTQSQAAILNDMYYRVRDTYSGSSNMETAWRYSRLLGGIYYDTQKFGLGEVAWTDIAGCVIPEFESQYFINHLGYTTEEYLEIANMVLSQHNAASSNNEKSDFAHFNISLAARLAYELDKDGAFSNVVLGTDIEVSYMAGWLGDAIIHDGPNDTIHFKNDDYKADLDAENIFQLLLSDTSYINAVNSYYFELDNYNYSRAKVFLEYIPLDIVKYLIFDRLIPEEYDLESDVFKLNYIRPYSPDTYNFIWSLINQANNMENHA